MIKLKIDKVAKGVFVSTNSKSDFSENYLEMLPNTAKMSSRKIF